MAYAVPLTRSPPIELPPHPRQPTVEGWREWALAQSPRALDLFAGAGGLSLGIERAGYSVVLAVDHNARAVETHNHNFPGRAVDLDLSTKKDLDLLVSMFKGTLE